MFGQRFGEQIPAAVREPDQRGTFVSRIAQHLNTPACFQSVDDDLDVLARRGANPRDLRNRLAIFLGKDLQHMLAGNDRVILSQRQPFRLAQAQRQRIDFVKKLANTFGRGGDKTARWLRTRTNRRVKGRMGVRHKTMVCRNDKLSSISQKTF